jgi:hypothetical protein
MTKETSLHTSAASQKQGVAVIQPVEPVALTIPNAQRMTGIGRTRLYDLMGSGAIDSIKVGKRRLVLVASIHRFVEAQKIASPALGAAA